jgi:hypothetical protein
MFVGAILSVSAAERYASVLVDQDRRVIVVTNDGRHITPPQDRDQVGAEQAAVAPDKQSVGWLALSRWCCTSYPIPMTLVVFSNGQVRVMKGALGEPIWYWHFQNGGRRVAFKEETPHGSMGLHYELWDVRSGRRVADYTPEYDENGRVAARPKEPLWVKALDASQSKPQ